jgi:hypothetical protein
MEKEVGFISLVMGANPEGGPVLCMVFLLGALGLISLLRPQPDHYYVLSFRSSANKISNFAQKVKGRP